MERSELSRKLLYAGQNDISKILEGSPLNQEIYKFLLEVMPKYQIRTQYITIFNELYYQCIRVVHDENPGQDLSERYLAEEKTWTGSSHTATLIFTLVWLVFSVQRFSYYKATAFQVEILKIISSGPFFQEAKILSDQIKRRMPNLQTSFIPQPAPVNQLPEFASPKPWRTITANYSKASIIAIIRRYRTLQDQHAVLKRIADNCITDTCTVDECTDKGLMFQDIHQQIDAEFFLQEEVLLFDASDEADNKIDLTPIRLELLKYVSRLRPWLTDDWKSRYLKLWEGILDLDVVKKKIYDRGMQKHTNFNRNLVANITFYLYINAPKGVHIFREYNAAQFALVLEGDKGSSMHNTLRKNPSEEVSKALAKYVKDFIKLNVTK